MKYVPLNKTIFFLQIVIIFFLFFNVLKFVQFFYNNKVKDKEIMKFILFYMIHAALTTN